MATTTLSPLPPPPPTGPTNDDLLRLGVRLNALLPTGIDQPVPQGLSPVYATRLESERAFLRAVRTKVFRLGKRLMDDRDAASYSRLANTVQEAVPPATLAYQADEQDARGSAPPSIIQFPAYDQLAQRLGLQPPDLPIKAPTLSSRAITVLALQKGLNQAGSSLTADGKWGPNTKAALDAYLVNAGYAGTNYAVSGNKVTLPTALASSLEQLAQNKGGGGTVAPAIPPADPVNAGGGTSTPEAPPSAASFGALRIVGALLLAGGFVMLSRYADGDNSPVRVGQRQGMQGLKGSRKRKRKSKALGPYSVPPQYAEHVAHGSSLTRSQIRKLVTIADETNDRYLGQDCAAAYQGDRHAIARLEKYVASMKA